MAGWRACIAEPGKVSGGGGDVAKDGEKYRGHENIKKSHGAGGEGAVIRAGGHGQAAADERPREWVRVAGGSGKFAPADGG